MEITIDVKHVPDSKKDDIRRSLARVIKHWGSEIIGKPITEASLNIAETQTHKFIDSIETILPSGHRYWGGRMSELYLESVFLTNGWNDHIHQSPFKLLSPIWWGCDMCQEQQQEPEPAIKAVFLSSPEFALIESENQHAFVTSNKELEVGQTVALTNTRSKKSIIVEIDAITEIQKDQFINEFSLVNFD